MKHNELSILLVASLFGGIGCNGSGCNQFQQIATNAPAAQTPVLDQVRRPGVPPTDVPANASGEYEVLPSRSVVIRCRTPYPSDIEVTVDADALERTDSLPRIRDLEGQDRGYYRADVTNSDWATTGEAEWEIIVSAPPSKRIGPQFSVSIKNISINPNHSGLDKTSLPLETVIVQGPTDLVRLVNTAGTAGDPSPVVLLDGRRPGPGLGCTNDEILRPARIINIVEVGNVLSNGPCNSEVIVFSLGRAMELISPVTAWTDAVHDLLHVDLVPPWRVPMTVWWLVTGDPESRAQLDVARANELFDTSRCGIGFDATHRNVVGNSNAANLVDGASEPDICSPNWITALRASPFFTPGQLNVYYSDVAWSFGGAMCPADPNIVVISRYATNETLAHEIGHSFSLGHTDQVSGMPNTNMMFPGGLGRTEFTEGQCFRCNVNPSSTLNSNQIRTRQTRNCPDGTTSSLCPALTLDVPN